MSIFFYRCINLEYLPKTTNIDFSGLCLEQIQNADNTSKETFSHKDIDTGVLVLLKMFQ